jgi:hypothetical protein
MNDGDNDGSVLMKSNTDVVRFDNERYHMLCDNSWGGTSQRRTS